MNSGPSDANSPSAEQKLTVKSKIEALARDGLDYAQIAKRLGIRYQHVHNVLGAKGGPDYRGSVEYEAAEILIDRCLYRQDSYLWPERSVWSVETIQRYIDAIQTSTVAVGTFYARLEQQIAGQPSDVYRFTADLLALYYLFPGHVRRETKMENIRRVASWGIPDDPPDPIVLESTFNKGIGGVGTHYLSAQAYEMLFFAFFALEAKVDQLNLDDPVATQKLADRVLLRYHDCSEARHLILHFLFPDLYEPIVSNRHKKLIADAFKEYSDGSEDVDSAIRSIREHLTSKFGENFSFYDPKVEALWQPAGPAQAEDPQIPQDGEQVLKTQLYALSDLQRDTLWPEERLGEILEALDGSLPVVLAGPPGTGKTWVAKCLVRFLTGDDPQRHRLVQFHPGFAYEQFIEGLQPVIGKSGAMSFAPVPGVLVKMARQIDSDGPNHYLVIDEMNRANLPRVMGELMYLLEYRGESIELPYSGKFELPRNLRLIGTMNTADRSIRSIDAALRRRFEIFECSPDSAVLEQYYRLHKNEVPDLVEGFGSLNAWLTQELDSHHTIGHTFFMRDVLDRKRIEQVWRRQLWPLFEEYFFDQPERLSGISPAKFWPSLGG